MLEKILLAVDESEHARKVVSAAAELARAGGGTVHVLHVHEVVLASATVDDDSPEAASRLVDEVVEELRQAGVAAEGSVRSTTAGPARAILEHARDLDATLIVLGSRGLGALGGLLLGSVAHKIIQLSSCPVLVVRDKQSLDDRHHDVLRAQTRFQA
jgi:nucleotide-binding universal stress UspA family protein